MQNTLLRDIAIMACVASVNIMVCNFAFDEPCKPIFVVIFGVGGGILLGPMSVRVMTAMIGWMVGVLVGGVAVYYGVWPKTFVVLLVSGFFGCYATQYVVLGCIIALRNRKKKDS